MPSSPASSRPATELCRLPSVLTGTHWHHWHCLLPPGPRAQLLIPCIAPTSAHWRPPGTAGPPLNTAGAAANINPTHQQIPHKALNHQKLNDIQAAQADLSDCRQKVFSFETISKILRRHLYLQPFPAPPSVFNSQKFLEIFGSHSFQGFPTVSKVVHPLWILYQDYEHARHSVDELRH